ncbi:hypothetical protein JTE90_015870 [Oedothorax gibbosus]|uniref:Sushi, von Willebrand factor type A, EGF and pentraxin domain-containing protein 1 n=1 Tax=Oedothorax gibbosus TaxID=931172 RepID=A0AAV6VTA5_9ARAC|nr:hypothetical protein JTE90_015870 [Oedothorax gibbosus]
MLLIVSLVIIAISAVKCEFVAIKADLQPFISSLEQYTFSQNDVVFLLDESGSIGAANYLEVKNFTNLIVRHFSVTKEHTRVAIVSFATEPRTMVNNIKDSDGKNMCLLVKSIEDLDYVGEYTYTSLAMVSAREILAHARPNANKIIILLSDGQSNSGYSPIAAATQLKQEGVIIFSVGVADVNQAEMEAVATSKQHIYILNDFKYIKDLNAWLRKASNDTDWDRAKDDSLCNQCESQTDCCDDHAACYCGTLGGSYECVCDAGYQGSQGLKGGCSACPRGTYKIKEGNSYCEKCPPYSTTLNEGSTSREDCVCEVGHEKHGEECKPVECVKLKAPEGGVIIPTHCSNLYGSQCTLKCKEGFCPYSCSVVENLQKSTMKQLSLPSRTCLKTGNWSGDDFHCEQMRCPVLNRPSSGTLNCSDSDFIFGTTCHFGCETGYELSGSAIRTCLPNGTWTGIQTHCTEITCNILKRNKILLVKPDKCAKDNRPYRSVCQYHCIEGYSLVSQFGNFDGKKECLANKTWSGEHFKITCVDTSPPTIKCPASIRSTTEDSKGTRFVEWEEPVATDNEIVTDITIKSPSNLRKPFSDFPIGTVKIVYEATDDSNNSNTCSFTVTIIDKEPPKVLSCPKDIEVYHELKSPIPVKWIEPEFSDNSGRLKTLTNNRKSGSEFQWGPPSVISYTVSDESGNTASCSFKVKVKMYPCPLFEPPENGVVTCDQWQDGRLCSVFCNDGYDFASTTKVPKTYECLQERKGSNITSNWIPFPSFEWKRKKTPFQFPVPDCSKKVKRSAVNETYIINYSVDFCNDKVVERMQKEFIKSLKSSNFKRVLCPDGTDCKPENVNVSCGSSHNTKQKRSISPLHSKNLIISFSIALYSNASTELSTPKAPKSVPTRNSIKNNSYLKAIESVLTQNVKKIYNTTTIPSPQVNYSFSPICTEGQITSNKLCVSCPAGTYKDIRINSCVDCPAATYQDRENSLSCSSCPIGYTTSTRRSKSVEDCKAPCQPGTYSRTTFEPCLPCPLNTYKENTLGRECLKCPHQLQTWKIGSNSSEDCVSPCKPGSYSSTGLEPCSLCDYGSYQNKEQQKFCELCPDATNTRQRGSSSQTQCEEIDLCVELHPCSNSSTCVPTERSFKCFCGYGYVGKYCEEIVDFCEDDPCFNNGTCTTTPEGPKCTCPVGFSENFCEINVDDCEQGHCYNNGKCIDLINDYMCECQEGFSGSKCEVNIFDCASEPCLNGGTCFDQINDYKCCCPDGYFGKNCENTSNICEENCKNGVCVSFGTSFKCDCFPGFSGSFCETNIDDCHNYCFNHGTCVDGIGNATCECPKKFYGRRCELAINSEYLLRFEKPMTSNYVELQNNQLLYGITVSFFMRTSYQSSKTQPTVISYSYYDKEKEVVIDNGLTLFNLNNLVLYLHGQMLHTGHIANRDSNWHHYAVTWERNEGKWSVFVDGKSISSGRDLGTDDFIWPGVFIIGQEQDTLGGGFSGPEAFAGDISEFNVWDYALSAEEISSSLSHCGKAGNLIPWYIAQRHVHGSVSVLSDIDLCKKIGTCTNENCFCFHSEDDSAAICKHFVKDCNPNPCQNNQVCVQNDNKETYCNCSSGYEGKFCEYDINECLVENGGCSNQCINTIGSHECMCPDGMHLSSDGQTCIDSNFCKAGDKLYLNNESWTSNCQKCSCELGNVNCTKLECPFTKCLPEENLMLLPGDCCPKCISYSYCILSPNNSVSTLDYLQVQFSNNYDFTLVEDCYNGDLSVRLDTSEKEPSLSIYQTCSKIQIMDKIYLLFFLHYVLSQMQLNVKYVIFRLQLVVVEHVFQCTTTTSIHISAKCYGGIYGGCAGNENRFRTLEECDNACQRFLLKMRSNAMYVSFKVKLAPVKETQESSTTISTHINVKNLFMVDVREMRTDLKQWKTV